MLFYGFLFFKIFDKYSLKRKSYFCHWCLSLSSSCDSVESFTGSVNSRATERDWDNGSTASSTTAKTEYTGEDTDPIMGIKKL